METRVRKEHVLETLLVIPQSGMQYEMKWGSEREGKAAG